MSTVMGTVSGLYVSYRFYVSQKKTNQLNLLQKYPKKVGLHFPHYISDNYTLQYVNT